MKTFKDYVDIKEIAAYDIGSNLLGQTALDKDSERALTAAFQAFELIMSKNPQAATAFLHRMAPSIPEIQSILQQNGLDSFRDVDFRTAMITGAKKGHRFLSKGLGDVSTQDANKEVIAGNSADSYHNPLN